MYRYSVDKFKRGGVSMFIVIVSTTLITLIVAGFMRLQVRDQQYASVQDLSQSAYDSANAGVEDVKRFMSIYNNNGCTNPSNSSTACNRLRTALSSSPNSCNALNAQGFGVGQQNGETLIQSSSGQGQELNQAYTCLKVRRNSPDYLGSLDPEGSKIIPLKSLSNFNRVRISWHTNKDGAIALPEAASTPLHRYRDWKNRPALIKAQFFGKKSNSSLGDLDKSFAGDGVGLSERFYYPVGSSIASAPASLDGIPSTKRSGGDSPSRVICSNDLNSRVYACQVVVNLGGPIDPQTEAYLRLTTMYRSSNFKVELMMNDSVVDFDGVQMVVDSTGRANDQFRRVESRLEVPVDSMPLPEFALQIEGDGSKKLCKDFWVTNKTQHFECE